MNFSKIKVCLVVVLLAVCSVQNSLQSEPVNPVLMANDFALNVTMDKSDAFVIHTLAQLHTAIDNALIKLKCNIQQSKCRMSHNVAIFEASSLILNSLVGGNAKLKELNAAGLNLYNPPSVYSEYKIARGIGKLAAYEVLADRLDDGFNEYRPYLYKSGSLAWRSSDPDFVEPNPATNGLVRSYLLGDYTKAMNKFGVEAPLVPGSKGFVAQVSEVARLGSNASVQANAKSRDICDFWNAPNEPGMRIVNKIAQDLLADKYNPYDSFRYARAFRVLNTVMHDATFLAYYVKDVYNTLRPRWWINKGVPKVGDEPSLAADPSWVPYLLGDNYPEYPDYYTAFSAGISALSRLNGGSGVNVAYDSIYLKKKFSYTSLNVLSDEALMSDIYCGTNFRFSTFGNAAVARRVSDFVALELKKLPLN